MAENENENERINVGDTVTILWEYAPAEFNVKVLHVP